VFFANRMHAFQITRMDLSGGMKEKNRKAQRRLSFVEAPPLRITDR
jgi:hypothetical protein